MSYNTMVPVFATRFCRIALVMFVFASMVLVGGAGAIPQSPGENGPSDTHPLDECDSDTGTVMSLDVCHGVYLHICNFTGCRVGHWVDGATTTSPAVSNCADVEGFHGSGAAHTDFECGFDDQTPYSSNVGVTIPYTATGSICYTATASGSAVDLLGTESLSASPDDIGYQFVGADRDSAKLLAC